MKINGRQMGINVPGSPGARPLRRVAGGQYLAARRVALAGLGEFVPACFPVPQIPVVTDGSGGSGLGEFAPASFPVPQIPVGASGLQGLGCSGGCGCGGQGMGDVTAFTNSLTSGDFTSALTNSDFIGGVPNWVVIAGGLYFVMSLVSDVRSVPGRVRKHRAAASRATAAYRSALA